MRLKPALIKVHRWLSLAMVTLWALQILSGMICVFHWELDDATIRAPLRPLDLTAIQRRVAMLAPAGSPKEVTQIWTSAGAPGRWDVTLAGADAAIVRIDNAGNILRTRKAGERMADGGLIDSIDNFHQTLLAGDAGGWIVGVSGILLLSNLVLGLVVAWPRRGQWRRSMRLPRAGAFTARLYGWHRALGLWLAWPALLLVTTGILSVFSDGFDSLIGASTAALPMVRPDGRDIGMSAAVGIVLRAHPEAALAAVDFPTADNATWTIRLLEPGELSRAYGTSAVSIDARNGQILSDRNAAKAPIVLRVADAIVPIHTGEALGVYGRLAVLALGAWLISTIAMGVALWQMRRRRRRGGA